MSQAEFIVNGEGRTVTSFTRRVSIYARASNFEIILCSDSVDNLAVKNKIKVMITCSG